MKSQSVQTEGHFHTISSYAYKQKDNIMMVIISFTRVCPYYRLFCTDNTIEFFVSVVRRTWKTIAGGFYMIEE